MRILLVFLCCVAPGYGYSCNEDEELCALMATNKDTLKGLIERPLSPKPAITPQGMMRSHFDEMIRFSKQKRAKKKGKHDKKNNACLVH